MRQPRLADRDQLALRSHRFHVTRPAPRLERGNAEITAVADLPGGDWIHHLLGKLRQKLRGGNQRLLDSPGRGELAELLKRTRRLNLKIARGSTPQRL